MQPLRPIVLEGRHLRLEPAEERHAEELWATVDGEALRYMPFRVGSAAQMRELLARGRAVIERGEGLGFVQCALPSGEVAGHTGFWNVAREHARLEIGATWLAPRFRRTAINTETKLLLLRHAFVALECRRVEFKTDARNARSRTALLRIGAVEEGTLRAHMLLPDGSVRDSVYYSVLAAEWPAVEARLEGMLSR